MAHVPGSFKVKGRSIKRNRFNPRTSQGDRYDRPDRKLPNTHRARVGPVRTVAEVANRLAWTRYGYTYREAMPHVEDTPVIISRRFAWKEAPKP